MKVLQLGSGSMGTRRMRDLHTRKGVTLALYDEREDRRLQAKQRFGVETFARVEDALAWKPDALVISTPPGTKGNYVNLALEKGLHHFIEADIWSYEAAKVERVSKTKNLVSAPSASLLYLPVVRALRKTVAERLGSVLFYQAFMSTYMPAWHPTEGVEYYARQQATTAAREMIPFELNWLNAVFSPAEEVSGRFERHGSLPGGLADTWSLSMRLKQGVGQLTITMACPIESRKGTAFGTNGMVSWDLYSGDLTWSSKESATPRTENHGAMGTVLEAMYAEEINTFIDAAEGRVQWPQPYSLSNVSSATLAAAERSYATARWLLVDAAMEPGRTLPSRS